MLRVNAGGVEILGRPNDLHPRVEGLFFGPDGFNGWDDGADVRRESVERPGADGEFDLPVFLGSRVFSLEGHALAWSEPELAHLRSRVTGLGAAGGRLRFSVEHQGQVLWADARLGTRPTFKDAGIRSGMLQAKFFAQFVAADPRKYGEVHDFPGGTAAVNRGNFPARPQLLIGAGSGGYTVTGPDGRKVIVGTAPSAAHEIDFTNGGLYLGGVRQTGAITTYQPWTVGPGLPGTVATISGSRSLVQRVTDTFI